MAFAGPRFLNSRTGSGGSSATMTPLDNLGELAPLQRGRRTEPLKPFATSPPKIPGVTCTGGTRFPKKCSTPCIRGSTGFYNLALAASATNKPPVCPPKAIRPSSARVPCRQQPTETDDVDKPTFETTVPMLSRSKIVRQPITERTIEHGDTNSAGNSDNDTAWSKLLSVRQVHPKPTTSTTTRPKGRSFQNFDPLRTLHFLGKELQSKLKSELAGNATVRDILSEMENALTRIPSEVSLTPTPTTTSEQTDSENKTRQRSRTPSRKLQQRPVKLDSNIDDAYRQKGESIESRTAVGSTPGKLRRHLETTAAKLDDNCRHLEREICQLKRDNEQLNGLLGTEKEMVSFLKKELDDVRSEKTENDTLAYQRVMKERDALHAQLRRVEEQQQHHAEQTSGATHRELKRMLDGLESERDTLKQENIDLRHRLTLSDMEKEKFVAILNVRDRQINEIRLEMSQLQEAVNDQLTELQKSPFLSASSSTVTESNSVEKLLMQNMCLSLDKCKAEEEEDQHLEKLARVESPRPRTRSTDRHKKNQPSQKPESAYLSGEDGTFCRNAIKIEYVPPAKHPGSAGGSRSRKRRPPHDQKTNSMIAGLTDVN